MEKRLRTLLEQIYQEEYAEATHNDAEAEEARQAGDISRAFDLTIRLRFADVCWALERWSEARHWYRHTAHILLKRRAWHARHSGPDYPLDELSDWEAPALVKAGHLEAAQQYLEQAVAYWQTQPESQLVLARLGLYAAQAQMPHLAPLALEAVAVRQELLVGGNATARRVRTLLHYEPAQVALLLGRWDELQTRLEPLTEAERLLHGRRILTFPRPLQQALLAAARGLDQMLAMRHNRVELEAGRAAATTAFEQAMLDFYTFNGDIDHHTYFMRLNTRLADDLAAQRLLNPNPFTTEEA
jgi:hypothetical protein